MRDNDPIATCTKQSCTNRADPILYDYCPEHRTTKPSLFSKLVKILLGRDSEE